MNRIWIFCIVAVYPTLGSAQTSTAGSSGSYQPAVPAPTMVQSYGGWNGGASGGTPAGNALNGLAGVISAQGDYNLATSAAAVNMTQAERNDIQNRQLWTNTYFEMRRINRAARAEERGPAPTMEQIARIAKEGVPKPLQYTELDPVTGRIAWPGVLQQKDYASQRGELEELFSTRAKYGMLPYVDQVKARKTIEGMFDTLKGQIRQVPTPDYLASRNFLQSLEYAVSKSGLE